MSSSLDFPKDPKNLMAGAFVSWLPWAYARCAMACARKPPMYRHWGDEVGNHGEPRKTFMVTTWFMYTLWWTNIAMENHHILLGKTK